MKLWDSQNEERSALFWIVMVLAAAVLLADTFGYLDLVRPRLQAIWHAVVAFNAPEVLA